MQPAPMPVAINIPTEELGKSTHLLLLPKDFILWSLFTFKYMDCCCLGFIALVFSIKTRDHRLLGDINGATHFSETAKYLNVAAWIASFVGIILFIVLFIASPNFKGKLRGVFENL